MNTKSNQTWMYNALAAWERQKPIKPVEYPSGDVVTPSQPMNLSALGKVIRVPPMTCALVSLPSGRVETYLSGEHFLGMPPGKYSIQYVDLRQQTMGFPNVKAVSSDAWDIVFNLNVLWQVVKPMRVIQSRNLLPDFETICRSMVVNFIRKNPHDQLVSIPGETPLAIVNISAQLRTILQEVRIFDGLEILDVLILDIQGDRRRTEIIQKSIVEKTEIDQTLILQRQKAQLVSEKLNQEQSIAQQRQQLAVNEARINRLKNEEEDQFRLRKAEITAKQAELERGAQLQEIQMQQMSEYQRLQHEQTLKAMEVRGQAFGQLASAIMQSSNMPGLQRGMEGDSREVIARALEALAKSLPQVPPMLPLSLHEPITQKSIPVYELLVNEVRDANSLPGARCEGPIELSDKKHQVSVNYVNLAITIVCDEDYPANPPLKVTVQYVGWKKDREIKVNWLAGMCVRDIILQTISKLVAESTFTYGKNNDHRSNKNRPMTV